jgi:uncharacterized RDD family membrane protein YckC
MTTPTGSGPEHRATTPIITWEAPAEEVGPAPGVKFAGHGARFLAYILDSIIVTIVFVILFVALSAVFVGASVSGEVVSPSADGDFSNPTLGAAAAVGLILVTLLVIIVAFAYFPFFWARSGQTPGMRPFGLYVVRDRDGGKISTRQAIVRLIGMWVSAIVVYIGFVWIFIDSRHRGWHDLMAGTVMIERTKR